MYNYLKQHPDIFMPSLKEPHYFGDDHHHINRAPRTLDRYLDHFHDAEDEKRVGDASTSYLHSTQAPSEIKEFNPSSKIIVMLRNPIKVMYALYYTNRLSGFEPIEDFESALEAEPRRKKGLLWPDKPGIVDNLFYREIAQFSSQLKRYFETFGRKKVKVITFNYFEENTPEAYRELLKFLDVDDDFTPLFEIANKSRTIRSNVVHRLINEPPELIRTIISAVLPPTSRVRISQALRRLNSTHKRRPPMDPELRRRLKREFTPEVKRLGKLLDRDLMHWVDAQET